MTEPHARYREANAMEQTLRVYRGQPRNTILAVAFGCGAAFFAAAAAVSRPSIGGMVGFGLLAALMLYVAVRCALMKAVATPAGLALHGPFWTVRIRWADIAKIEGADTETDARLFAVRAPVLVLTRGHRVKVIMASSYDLSPKNGANTNADRIATELESLRTAHTR
jgi:hypothetical protein